MSKEAEKTWRSCASYVIEEKIGSTYNLKFVKWRKSVDFNFGVKEIYKPNIRVFFNKKNLKLFKYIL